VETQCTKHTWCFHKPKLLLLDTLHCRACLNIICLVMLEQVWIYSKFSSNIVSIMAWCWTEWFEWALNWKFQKWVMVICISLMFWQVATLLLTFHYYLIHSIFFKSYNNWKLYQILYVSLLYDHTNFWYVYYLGHLKKKCNISL
jgi:hypothetical protein